jgi:hypothetical protein
MKRVFLFISITFFYLVIASFYSEKTSVYKRVNFYVSGTGSKGITIKLGVGPQIGSGSCCYPLTPTSSMVRYSAEEGDVLYDSERNRVIVKINASMEGATINLKDYY